MPFHHVLEGPCNGDQSCWLAEACKLLPVLLLLLLLLLLASTAKQHAALENQEAFRVSRARCCSVAMKH